jgi:hypothetical protein
MSSGAFVDSFYSSNELGSIHPIRVQPETLALELGGQANAAPAGTTAILPSAQVSRGKRAIGINARTVTIQFTATKAGYLAGSKITLPWLASATFAAIKPKATVGTYQEVACKVVGKSPETVK